MYDKAYYYSSSVDYETSTMYSFPSFSFLLDGDSIACLHRKRSQATSAVDIQMVAEKNAN